jgi:signal transduction histidine kinase
MLVKTRFRKGLRIKMKSRRGYLVVAALLFFAMVSVAIAEPKRVLLLHSFGRDFAPWNEYARSIREELIRQSPEPIDLFEASLATARFAGDDEGPFVEYLRTLFIKRRLDLMVTVGAPAANFIQRHRQHFPSPMLFTGIEQRRVPLTALTADDAVVAVSIDLEANLANILRVLPDTTNIAVVVGHSPIEKYWLEQLRIAAKPFLGRVTFEWFDGLSFDQMLKRVATLPPRSAVFFVLLSVDAAGVPHEEAKAFTRLREVTNAPVFGFDDSNFGRGATGGPLIAIADVGRKAADVALRILGGAQPGSLNASPVGAGIPKYDWRELQRWSISENRLPPRSETHFRIPSTWQQYRWQLITAAAIVLFQSLMIAALLIQRRRLQIAEVESRSRLLEVIHLSKTATAGVMSASIAHELNQPLGSILSNAETAEILLAKDPLDRDQLKEILVDIREADQRAAEIIRQFRTLLKKKSELELQEFDLNDTVRVSLNLLGPEAAKRGVDLRAHYADRVLSVSADQVHIQQVILNLAMNGMDAMQDSAANSRKLKFETALTGDGKVEVSVSDSGPGIPPGKLTAIFEPFFTTKEQGTGLGLSIVRTIVETYGGRVWAENLPSGGATFRFAFPLASPPD